MVLNFSLLPPSVHLDPVNALGLRRQNVRLIVVSDDNAEMVCHDSKLMVKDSSDYFRKARDFSRNQVFPRSGPWPDVILAPSFSLGFSDREVVDVEVMVPNAIDGQLNGTLENSQRSSDEFPSSTLVMP